MANRRLILAEVNFLSEKVMWMAVEKFNLNVITFSKNFVVAKTGFN